MLWERPQDRQGQPGAFVLGAPSEAPGDLLITDDHIYRRLERLGQNTFNGPDGTRPAIYDPLAGILASYYRPSQAKEKC